MSWHCSQALVAAFSVATCSDGAPSVLSSSTPTPVAFYWPDKTTEHSRLSRFGMTSEPLMADHGAALLTWFLAASRAKTSASLAKATGSTGSEAGSGRKWLGSLAKFDHDSRSWRTAQRSLLGGSEEFLETWPRWGSMRNGECSERTMLEPLTSANASGLWPTPVADDTGSRSKKYAQGGTPLSLAVKLWPTPTAGNHKSGGYLAEWGGSRSRKTMAELVPKEEMFGPLNPEWVEWLMNWPIGWTSLEPLDHDNFKHWQESSAAYFQSNRVCEMWFDADPAEASQRPQPAEQRAEQRRGSLPDMPQGRPHDRWDMGQRECRAGCVQSLLADVPAHTNAPRIDLRIGVSERVGKDQCAQAVVPRMKTGTTHRVDRLKAIGNGQVSRVAAAAFPILTEAAC